MQNDQFYSPRYKGTKAFSQHEVRTANATVLALLLMIIWSAASNCWNELRNVN